MGIREILSIYEGNIEDLNSFEVASPIKVFKEKYELIKKDVYNDEQNANNILKHLEREAQLGVLELILKTASKKVNWKRNRIISGISYPYLNIEKTISNKEKNKYDFKITIEAQALLYQKTIKPIENPNEKNKNKENSKIEINELNIY